MCGQAADPAITEVAVAAQRVHQVYAATIKQVAESHARERNTFSTFLGVSAPYYDVGDVDDMVGMEKEIASHAKRVEKLLKTHANCRKACARQAAGLLMLF